MKVIRGKCHILLIIKNPIDVHLEGACITSSSCEKLLGIPIDSDLKFGRHISDFSDKVSKKKKKMPSYRLYVFRKTQDCNYCPLIWMLHSRA